MRCGHASYSSATSSQVLVVARAVVDLALGPGALTPLVIRIPDTGMVMASVATTVGTTFIAFSASLTMLRKLHQRAEALQCSMKEATSMAQCIVNFDLDDLPKPSSHSGIVDLMVQVGVGVEGCVFSCV